MSSLLITNDFPPKIGGIQSYLWELWSRLPGQTTTVMTTPHADAGGWDDEAGFRIERTPERFLLPSRSLRARVESLAGEVDASVIFVDPMLPVGLIGPRLKAAPYVVVAHGAEVTVYGRAPVAAQLGRTVLREAAGVVAAGEYAARQVERVARRTVPTLVIPPGVDTERFRPLSADERDAARRHFGLRVDAPLVLGLSRLVPRKGFDVLIDAVAGLDDVQLVLAGTGRDRERLVRRAERAPGRVQFLGPVAPGDLGRLFGCVDVFAMPCRDRWGGLEAEGFGIVFLEAAAAGIPAIAGRSGGSHEAVVHGETGFVVEPRDVTALRGTLASVLGDEALRRRLGQSARHRAETEFSYEHLVARLAPLAAGQLDVLRRD